MIVYQQDTGQRPFEKWFEKIRDERARTRVAQRIRQVQNGTLGDWKPVGEGVLELRVDVGAGYRIYCGRRGDTLVVLLCGGDKSNQGEDIKRAKLFWTDWKRRSG
ncbi:MAG TPA: type II toxin-antitoxin system RelE/ParE family toxin [Terracidiphilus sp.]